MAFVVGIILWPIVTRSPYAREQAFVLLMYMALASSLNIILGYTGYVCFGHIVFFGIGGYTGFYLIHRYHWHMIPAAIAGGIAAGPCGLPLGCGYPQA
jgi:branched-chain amino acid transport system permease protein